MSLFKASGVEGFHVPDRSRFAPPSLSFGDCCLIRNLLVYLVFCICVLLVGLSDSLVIHLSALLRLLLCFRIAALFGALLLYKLHQVPLLLRCYLQLCSLPPCCKLRQQG